MNNLKLKVIARNRQSLKFKKGFTLIELLVVMAIIGSLATLLVANFNSARERARDAQRKSDLHNIQTALRLYKNDVGIYPTSNSGDQLIACGGSACTWGSAWTNNNNTYMSELPDDPVSARNYHYVQTNSEQYSISACLENGSDNGCVAGGAEPTWCQTSDGCVYTIRP